jgi:Tfp pilus assembly protein PilV
MKMRSPRLSQIVLSRKGFSLIELVTFIIVGGIILPASIIAFTAVMGNFSAPDYQVKARFYCQQTMEQLTSNAYAGIAVTGGDVVGASPEAGFQRKWNICYVSASNPGQCTADQAVDTNYKKLTISVTTPDNSAYDVSTLISRRPKS